MSKQQLGALQTLWVEALESGKYKQGFGRMRPAPGVFCVLGVALDAILPTCEDNEWDQRVIIALRFRPDKNAALAKRNDTDRWTFPRFARYLRRYAHLVFKEPA